MWVCFVVWARSVSADDLHFCWVCTGITLVNSVELLLMYIVARPESGQGVSFTLLYASPLIMELIFFTGQSLVL